MCGPLPSGDYLFVITDEYSSYHNSCFQLFLSTLAVLIVFIIRLLNDSTWEFARGYDGVTRRSLNPMFSAYCRNAYELNADSITKTKAFMRSKVWFPGLHDRVDHAMNECAACQSVIHTKRIEPLKTSEMPSVTIGYTFATNAPQCL
jgi:hypothetical protein